MSHCPSYSGQFHYIDPRYRDHRPCGDLTHPCPDFDAEEVGPRGGGGRPVASFGEEENLDHGRAMNNVDHGKFHLALVWA